VLFALVALAAPAAASPAEDALFRWADKCPSTAMQAGIYRNAGVDQLSVAEKAVFRVRTRDEGAAVRLVELLDEAVDRCASSLKERAESSAERAAERAAADGEETKKVIKVMCTVEEERVFLPWEGYVVTSYKLFIMNR
jgi:hypothetical protein